MNNKVSARSIDYILVHHAVRLGALEPRLANCVGYLCSVTLNGLSQVTNQAAAKVEFIIHTTNEEVPPSDADEYLKQKKGLQQV